MYLFFLFFAAFRSEVNSQAASVFLLLFRLCLPFTDSRACFLLLEILFGILAITIATGGHYESLCLSSKQTDITTRKAKKTTPRIYFISIVVIGGRIKWKKKIVVLVVTKTEPGKVFVSKILKIQRTAKEMGKGKYILQTVVSTIAWMIYI